MRTVRLKTFLLLWPIGCAFVVPEKATAQQVDSTNVVVAKMVTIHSKILDQDRKIYIYTPDMSPDKTFTGQAYPVLYLMDGDRHTALVASQVAYLSTIYTVLPPMIVVGINNYGYDRMGDLTPTHSNIGYDGKIDTTSLKTTGGGEKFLQFVKEEVMPFVNEHYKTQPFTIFSGHSLGGLMTTYCLVNHPDYFNAYIAVSPALWIDRNAEVKDVMEHLKPGELKHKFFFMSDGNEGGVFHKPVFQVDSIIRQRKSANLTYKYISYPDETHGSEPVKAIYDGLRLIYPDWEERGDSTGEMIKKHFEKLSDTYGYKILPFEAIINSKAYNLMNNPAKLNDAIAMFKLNIEYYPKSGNVYDSLGDAYAQRGDKDAAITCYQKSLSINPKNSESQKKLDSLLKK